MTLGEFSWRMVFLCHAFNMRETSGARSRAWNASLGDDDESTHLAGFGRDCGGHAKERVPGIINMAKRMGIWVKDEGDHLNFQPMDMTRPNY